MLLNRKEVKAITFIQNSKIFCLTGDLPKQRAFLTLAPPPHTGSSTAVV